MSNKPHHFSKTSCLRLLLTMWCCVVYRHEYAEFVWAPKSFFPITFWISEHLFFCGQCAKTDFTILVSLKVIQHYHSYTMTQNFPWTRHFNPLTRNFPPPHIWLYRFLQVDTTEKENALHFNRHLPFGQRNWTTASTKHSLHEPVKMPTKSFFFFSAQASYKYVSIWKVTVCSFPPGVHMVPVFMGWWGLLLGFRVVIIWGMLQLQ